MGYSRTGVAFASNSQDDSWKSQGFINLALPRANGTNYKLGALGLKEANAGAKALLDMLNKDASQVTKIVANLVIEYRSTKAGTGSGLLMFGGGEVERAASTDADKPRGYLNFSLPTEGNGSFKVGDGIPLRDNDDPIARQLADMFEKDPVAGAALLKQHLVGDYRSATQQTGKKAPVFKLV